MNLFGLDEIRVAKRLVLNKQTGALQNIYSNVALLFYQQGTASDGSVPQMDISYGDPGFAYTYQLSGTPFSTEERFDLDRRVFRGETVVERSVNLAA